jgi:hypothetical protein
MIPTAYRRNARGLRDRHTVEFESPDPPAATLRALAHEAMVTEDGPRPLRELGTVPEPADRG